MSKLTSLFIAGVSLLVSGFTAMPAQASPIIVDNPRPSTCKLIENDRLKERCNAFKLTRVLIDEKSRITGFRSEFSFKDLRVSYIAVVNGNVRTIRNNRGKTVNFYPIILQTLEQRGREPKSSGAEGVCGIASDYSEVICQISGSSYFYTGNPIGIQQNTENPQNSADNGNRYVFNTNSHVNTGISVNPGDKIKVQASGRIRFGFFAESGGPRGILFNPDYNYFVDILHGQLIGRIRRFGAQDLDGWFSIGEGREFVAKSQGVLEFAVNDNKPGDNAGSFRIEVTIDPARK